MLAHLISRSESESIVWRVFFVGELDWITSRNSRNPIEHLSVARRIMNQDGGSAGTSANILNLENIPTNIETKCSALL